MARADRIEFGGKKARTLAGILALAAGLGAGSGCGSIRVTDTPRSATEQMLLSDAWDQAIGAVDFSFFTEVPVALDDSLINGPDRGWMVYRIRESLARHGAILVDDEDEAAVLIEASAGVYGTDSNSAMLGIPANNLAGMLPFAPPVAMGEAALATRTDQFGVTRMALFARDRETGRFIWESGTIEADSYLRNATIAGVPFRSGTIEHPADRLRKRHFHRAARTLGLPGPGHSHH